MRRSLMALVAASALVVGGALAPEPALAAEQAVAPFVSPSFLHPVQFYGAEPHWGGDGWDRRGWRQEWRRERDEARIAEAARQEMYRIEAEREQRRAWWRARREQQHGYAPAYGYGGHQRGW
jgi:hypothetical protein